MKMIRCTLLLLLISVSYPLFSIDIYCNGILWHSYSQEDMETLQIKFSDESETEDVYRAIPFQELLPLMTETEGIRISFTGGELFINDQLHELRLSTLSRGASGDWILNLNRSVYHDPRRIDLYGRLLEQKQFILWTEPGVEGIEEQIEVWSSLHKVKTEIREIQGIGDELIHRRMTGDLMPDFILQFQEPSRPYEREKTVAFVLQSVRVPTQDQLTETLVLPSGHILHPDLFLSILASLSERVSPYDPGFMSGREEIRRATEIYFRQILTHRVVEQDDFFREESYRNDSFGFFPARAFPGQKGFKSPLPQLPGLGIPPSPRVYPLQMIIPNEELPQGALLDFLKLPGIQHHLLSVPERQLPERTAGLENRQLKEDELRLYREWKGGYILSESNYSFRSGIESYVPDLYRGEGELP